MRNVFSPGRVPACGAPLAQLHSLMPSSDMVCGVSCLCSRLGLLGLSCGCFLFAWLCPVCEDTILSRLRLLCAPVSAVDDCRGLGLADSFFSLYRKKGEALALAFIFACIVMFYCLSVAVIFPPCLFARTWLACLCVPPYWSLGMMRA